MRKHVLTYERMQKESEAAYAAFRTYLDLGPARTLQAVADMLGKHRDSIGKQSAQWKWIERARLWDNKVQRDIDAKMIAVRQKWEARRMQEQERVYERSQELDAKARAMAELPITRKVLEEKYEDGRVKTVVFEAAGWRQRDIVAMYAMATQLAKVAIDEAIPPQTGSDKQPDKAVTFSDARAEAMLEAAGRTDEDDDPPDD